MRLAGGAAVAAAHSPHPVLARLFDGFESGGVRWVLLHSPADGLGAPRGDIDLLVHPADVALARVLAGRNGFVRVPRSGRAHHYLRYCPDDDRWLWLHIVTAAGFGPAWQVPAEGEQGWLEGRMLGDGVSRLRPELAFWLLLWHCLASRGEVAPHHRQVLTELCGIAATGHTVERMFAAACGNTRLPARILRLVAKGEWSAVQGCASVVHAAQRRASLRRRLATVVRRAARAVAGRPASRGVTVAVIGPDGAGKTTLIEGLRNSVPLPSRTIYMGLSGGALRHARRLRLPGVVFSASALIIWSRYVRGWYHSARGRMVLFDRYVYDAFTPHPATLTTAQRWSRVASGHLCPAPDITILLDAPGVVMYARKRSYSAPVLENWRSHFRALSSRVASLAVIDATRTADAVRTDCVTAIWDRYAARWRRLDPMGGQQ